MGQQEFEDLVTHPLSGHVDWPPSPSIMQLEVGPVKEEKSGSVVATVEGGEEECCLALPET